MSLQNRFYLSDFVSIQRNSFLQFLEKGLIEEISKRNPITNQSNTLELFFYSEYYQLAAPKYTLRQAIIKGKSYSSKLYIPVQLTDKRARIIKMKWVHLCDLPVMTKRGHFLINGAARVVINQITRSPGIYYQSKTYVEQVTPNMVSQSTSQTFERHYADIICQRGTWLRLEIDKNKKIWAQTKKGPKIPIMWLLLAMGLTENQILKSVLEPGRLLYNMLGSLGFENDYDEFDWAEQAHRVMGPKPFSTYFGKQEQRHREESTESVTKLPPKYLKTPIEAWEEIYNLFTRQKSKTKGTTSTSKGSSSNTGLVEKSPSELGRQLIFNKFMNPRTYDLSKYGRLSINKKFHLNISQYQTALTPQDLLSATDYLLKVEYGLKKVDDIDNLKNRRVRTSGELIQMQFAAGLLRLEKSIKEKMTTLRVEPAYTSTARKGWQNATPAVSLRATSSNTLDTAKKLSKTTKKASSLKASPTFQSKDFVKKAQSLTTPVMAYSEQQAGRNLRTELAKTELTITKLIPNTKPINSALREFFGTSPLSQFMDQMNPLAEITHKRRLSSMGPGGVTRDSATLDIRGIHPSHYGRICPVETPEGKNTGLVNSLTTYARVNSNGYIETPYYKVYKGQVQLKTGMYFLSADHEEKIKLGAADLYASDIGFLSTSPIPVRVESDFTKITRDFVEYTGVSPNQMVSVATSLIPFLEHDDANRALMGSNMQRQSVPLLYPERPIVGTGFEARVVSDSGHALQAHTSGVVTYVSADKVCIYKLTRTF